MKSTNRKTYLDILRILAAFLVIFNHTDGYVLFQYAKSLPKFIPYTMLSIITTTDIPLFFMITGAVLLAKEEPLSVVLKKRVLRFSLLIISASTLMYLLVTPFREFTLHGWLASCLNRSIEGSYWYLYTHLAFLIMLPYIRKIVVNFNKNDFKYFIIVHCIIVTILPAIDYIVYYQTGSHFEVFPELTSLMMVYRSFFYPIMGYYLDKHFDTSKFKFRTLLPLYGACAIAFGIAIAFVHHNGITYGFTEAFLGMFDYLFAITLFLTAKCFVHQIEPLKNFSVFANITSTIAPLTLGIYVFYPALKLYIQKPLERFLGPQIPVLFGALAWCLVSMTVGGLITFVLKRIPGIKKIL